MILSVYTSHGDLLKRQNTYMQRFNDVIRTKVVLFHVIIKLDVSN